MKTTCTRYMFKGKWTDEFSRLSEINYYSDKKPELAAVVHAVILPAKESAEHAWGSGGAVAENGQLAEGSRLGNIFGEVYPFDRHDAVSRDETVYYIPVIPKHWGHFLLDVLCRFWFLLDGIDRGYRIAFCSLDFGEDGLTGNYLEALELLGVSRERLLFITKPTRFAKVLIPESTFGDGAPYCSEYSRIIDYMKTNALRPEENNLPEAEERIYFTRTQFRRSRYTEVGEKRIEELFRQRGFTVLAPEKLSVRDQIFYFSKCKEIASLSGTISHNIVFSEPGNRYILLNRCCLPNYAQFAVNQLSPAEVTYVDVYAKETARRPKYWPVWVEANDNLAAYFEDMGYPDFREDTAAGLRKKVENAFQFSYLNMRLKVKDLHYRIRRA